MQKTFTYIGIVENSPVITEGLENLLLKGDPHIRTMIVRNLEDIVPDTSLKKLNILIINPLQVINRVSILKSLKTNHPEIQFFAFMYAHVENQILSNFDDFLYITDSVETIHQKIKKSLAMSTRALAEKSDNTSAELTDREIDVLKEIVRGKSNKEIADKLNISVFTVMSHRKNITQKTQIKSQAGLTVYAINQNILSLDSL